MPELQSLAQLGFAEDVRLSSQEICDELHATPAECPPSHDRDVVARWLAMHHFAVWPNITDIYYLPDSFPNEIRLLEVNEGIRAPQEGIEAVDFRIDIEGLDYRLLVADLSPAEHESLRSRGLDLPDGWSLRGASHWKRR